MNTLIDVKTVESIRATGNINPEKADRVPILDQYNLPYDRPAENVVITGCQILPILPQMLASLTRIFNRGGLEHTYLSTEYCCGNTLYRPAIKARDDEAMAECRELSKGFVDLNLKAARELGAKRLIIFCSPCYPIFKHAAPDEDIIFYPAAISEVMEGAAFDGKIDFYAGCYKLHKRFSPAPMDLKSTNKVFSKIDGLTLNRISAPQCCYKAEGLAHMIDNIQTETMVHICTGCYGQALSNLPQGSTTKVMMLPEFAEAALGD
jgi:Fe-S oxidoreductase